MVFVTVANGVRSKDFKVETAAGLIPSVRNVFGEGFITDPKGVVLTSEYGNLEEGVYNCWSSEALPSGTGRRAVESRTVIVTYKKGTSTSAVKAFDKMPSWDEVVDPVTDMFKGEYTVEDPVFKMDKNTVERETWAKFADGKTEIELTVSDGGREFSSFLESEVKGLLDLSCDSIAEVHSDFPTKALDIEMVLDEDLRNCLGVDKVKDVLKMVGMELAFRCARSTPSQETSRRELISPILYAAAYLSSDVGLHAEYKVTGIVAKGNVDYVILLKEFAIIVVEAKLHERVQEHTGQLAAEIRSSREEYVVKVLGKCKHGSKVDEGDFENMPSFGILTNGKVYILYKYCRASRRLIKSNALQLNLHKGVTADYAMKQAQPVIELLMGTIELQRDNMKKFMEQHKRQRNE